MKIKKHFRANPVTFSVCAIYIYLQYMYINTELLYAVEFVAPAYKILNYNIMLYYMLFISF